MECGYIKLHRKVLDNGWLREPKLWALWCWCLLSASHKQHSMIVGCQQITLEPGQFVFGRKALAEQLGLTEQEIRTRIDSLRKRKNLTIKSTNKYSIGTIINWAAYQSDIDNYQPTNQPTTNQQLTTNKNVRMKEIKIYSPNSDEFRLSQMLLDKILERRNSFKKPDIQKWGVYIDRMIRIDKRPPEEIEKIIVWCQKDSFWQNNILSTEKLRAQYDKLALKAIAPESPWRS